MEDKHDVKQCEISIRGDGKVVWVNIDGVCELRVHRAEEIVINDERSNAQGLLIEKWYKLGQDSIKRKNKSGCVCELNDNDEVVSACQAHLEWKKNG